MVKPPEKFIQRLDFSNYKLFMEFRIEALKEKKYDEDYDDIIIEYRDLENIDYSSGLDNESPESKIIASLQEELKTANDDLKMNRK